MLRRRWAIHLLAIGLYLLLSLALTWPLAGQFTTHVPGDGGDDPAIAWNLWWVKWSLIDQGGNPFDCRYMFYPLGINLAFYTLTVLNGCLSIPLQAIFGLVTVSNLLLLSSFVLGGYGAFLLALDVIRPLRLGHHRSAAYAAAGLAGLIYAFSSSKLFYASLGQFNIASSQWIPYYALMLRRLTLEPRLRHAVLAGLFLLLQGWAEMTYAAFLLVFTALYLLYHLAGCRRWSEAGRLLGAALLAGAIFVAGMSPILAQMFPDMRAEGDFFVEGSGFAEAFSSDPVGFFIPTQLHPLLGGLARQAGFPHDKAQHYYLGYSVLALALLGFVAGGRRGDVPFWGISAGVFLVLTLGPTLQINGRDLGIPLPFQIFQNLPFFKGNRYPSRFGVLLVLSLAVLAGVGLAWALDRLRGRRGALVGAACALFFLFEHASVPLPMSDLRLPPAYAAIQEPGDYAILDLPIAWRNGFRITGIMHPIFMYAQFYQTSHHKRLLSGNTSRNPELKFQYFTEAPILNSLIALENGHTIDEARRQADRQLAPQVLHFFDIRYVVVHQPTAGAALLDYVESVLPVRLVYEDPTYRVYHVNEAATTTPNAPLARLALAEGWSAPAAGRVWMQYDRARLLWRAPAGASNLQLELRAPVAGSLQVSLNGCRLGAASLGDAWQTVSFPVPAGCLAATLNDVWLEYPVAPASAARSPDAARTLAGVIAPAEITVQSAGKEVGDFGHIYVDGVDRSPNRRGYNLVALDPTSGAVLAAANFDTHLDDAASSRLVDFVEHLPAGVIVGVAAMDEASMKLSEEAADALRSLGLAGSLRGRFRWSHAAIGVKGAAPGQALEMLSETMPATVVLGNGLTRPQVHLELRAWP
jgi:hypothetical protein